MQPRITKKKIDDIPTPKRVCFASYHKNSLKRVDSGGRWVGKFNIPFWETIGPIFEESTGISLSESQYGGYWFSIQNEEDFEVIEDFVDSFRDIVFLRDRLALSIALAENLLESGEERTEIGELEYRAKYWSVQESIHRLANICIDTINSLPFYKDVDIFCAVPPSDNVTINLPCKIINCISQSYEIEDITHNLKWEYPKASLKSLSKDDKWTALKEANLQVNVELNGKVIILIDDLYQSGLTIQYVAKKLIEAGAAQVFGVCLVKSRRDTDNG